MKVAEIPNGTFITYTTHQFQTNNLDLVEKAIEGMFATNISQYHIFEQIAIEVWTNRSVVMNWFKEDAKDGNREGCLFDLLRYG